MVNYLYTHFCNSCKLFKKDVPAEADRLICPGCSELMEFKGEVPRINLYTSDLPHSAGGDGFESYQPAFGKVTKSKREAMGLLHDFNAREKEKANIAGVPFQEFEWLGDSMSEKDKEFDQIRREQGAEALDNSLKEKHEEVMSTNLAKKLENVWKEIEV